MTELADCPFCDSSNVNYGIYDDYDCLTEFRCHNCGATITFRGKKGKLAIEMYNTRELQDRLEKELDNAIPMCTWCKNKEHVERTRKGEQHQWICTQCNHFI